MTAININNTIINGNAEFPRGSDEDQLWQDDPYEYTRMKFGEQKQPQLFKVTGNPCIKQTMSGPRKSGL